MQPQMVCELNERSTIKVRTKAILFSKADAIVRPMPAPHPVTIANWPINPGKKIFDQSYLGVVRETVFGTDTQTSCFDA